jgi:hypothetical protein
LLLAVALEQQAVEQLAMVEVEAEVEVEEF